jgi:ferredoxin
MLPEYQPSRGHRSADNQPIQILAKINLMHTIIYTTRQLAYNRNGKTCREGTLSMGKIGNILMPPYTKFVSLEPIQIQIKEFEMPAKGKIVVNDFYCKACGLCVSVCPTQVIQLAPERARLSPRRTVQRRLHCLRVLCHGVPGCRHYRFSVDPDGRAGGLTWRKN